MSIQIEVTGLDALRASLSARETKLSGDMVKRAFGDGANTIGQTAKQLAPHRTGWLSACIQTTASRAKDLARAKVIIDSKLFTGFPYGVAMERGWNAGKYAKRHVQGTHFFERALLAHSEDVPSAIVAKIWEELARDQ